VVNGILTRMTEPTRPLPDAPAEATDSAPAAVNITRLVAEAMSKSGILWIRLPGGDTHPAWFVWHDDGDERGTGPAAYVISGIGEQPLPWLPAEVDLLLRSKDSGGRLLTIGATVREIAPTDDAWEAAAAVLRPERLNLVGTTEDVDTRWRQGCTIHVLTPHGRPTEQPGAYAAEPGSRRIAPAKAASARWRPWHWRGRPQSRRGTR
jgi:hypothetical protein